MSLLNKRFFILGVVIVVITAALSWPAILKFGAQTALQEFNRRGGRISWSGLSTSFNTVGLKSLSFWVPGPVIKGNIRALVSIDSENATLKLKPSSLLRLSPVISFGTSGYGGTLSGDAFLFGETPSVDAVVKDIQLGLHPQLSSLGMRGGVLNGTLSGLSLQSGGSPSASFDMTLQQLVPPAQLPGDLPISGTSLGEIDIAAAGTLTPALLELKHISTKNNLLAIEGSSTVKSPFSESRTIQGTFTLSLSNEGLSMFGAWLPTITGGAVGSSDKVFHVGVVSARCSSNSAIGQQVPISDGCLKLSYSLN